MSNYQRNRLIPDHLRQWHKNHKTHFLKIRKEGYRDFYMSKGWRGVGYGAVKSVGGKERVMYHKGEGDNFCLCAFSLRYKPSIRA
jgi:hypothetical protein